MEQKNKTSKDQDKNKNLNKSNEGIKRNPPKGGSGVPDDSETYGGMDDDVSSPDRKEDKDQKDTDIE